MKDEIQEIVTFKTEDGAEHTTRLAAQAYIQEQTINECVLGCIECFREEREMDREEQFTDNQICNLVSEHFETLGQLYLQINHIDVH